jgi:hypothetical protein
MVQVFASQMRRISRSRNVAGLPTRIFLRKELADALAILLDHLDEWHRSQEGILPRPLWTLTKWRLCLDEDLPTACFLEILGQR